MDLFWPTMAVFGMFILRLGVPLTITVAVGYWLRRLDDRWQAEALARQAEAAVARQQGEPAIEMFRVIGKNCCEVNNCPEGTFHCCPAHQNADMPCWMARYRAEGRLPAKCYRCQLFSARRVRNYEQEKIAV
jgi:uncharacterized membrane protein YraQ (UPF0718 family)